MDKMYYSASTNGFYHPEIHGEHGMPADVEEITAAEHAALMEGQAKGLAIVAGKDGRPTLQERIPTAEEILAGKKFTAQAYLGSTDWYVTRKLETGKDIPEDVANKRAEARVTLS